MTRSFLEEIDQALKKSKDYLGKKITGKSLKIAFITSTLSKETMLKIKEKLEKDILNLSVDVYPVESNFSGRSANVSSLLMGHDLLDQLKGIEADVIMLPRNMLREDMLITLDGQTDESLSKQLEQEIYLELRDSFKFIDELGKVIGSEWSNCMHCRQAQCRQVFFI